MTAEPGIYMPLGLEGYEMCHPVKQSDFERIKLDVNGVVPQSTWTPIPMELIRENEGKSLTWSDSPWLGCHALIFRSNVIDSIGPMLLDNGELLPLQCSDAELVAFNPAKIDDALDEASSSVRRFTGGRIMRVERYVFRPDAINGADAFKISNLRVSPTFVSNRFVDAWHAAKLRGLEFTHEWGSNQRPVWTAARQPT